jgi:hypothetical protein
MQHNVLLAKQVPDAPIGVIVIQTLSLGFKPVNESVPTLFILVTAVGVPELIVCVSVYEVAPETEGQLKVTEFVVDEPQVIDGVNIGFTTTIIS